MGSSIIKCLDPENEDYFDRDCAEPGGLCAGQAVGESDKEEVHVDRVVKWHQLPRHRAVSRRRGWLGWVDVIKDSNTQCICKSYRNLRLNGKKKRSPCVQNAVHACLYCGKLRSHIQDHLHTKHANEVYVKEHHKTEESDSAKVCKEKRYRRSHLGNMLRAKWEP